MIPVQHPGWLGTDVGLMAFTDEVQAELAEYQLTIEGYGIRFVPVLFQYTTLAEAIAQAAEYVDASIVYAHIPESSIPFWTKLQQWLLNRQFNQQHCEWIQTPDYDARGSSDIAHPASNINRIAHHVR
jgi:hypothetical protein